MTKRLLWVAALLVVAMARPASAGEVQFKPIDTNNLVVKPTKTAAALTSATVNLVGQTAASQIDKSGYTKTINNLFGVRKTVSTPTQPGRSPLPAPGVFSSPYYKNYNTPVMPTYTRR